MPTHNSVIKTRKRWPTPKPGKFVLAGSALTPETAVIKIPQPQEVVELMPATRLKEEFHKIFPDTRLNDFRLKYKNQFCCPWALGDYIGEPCEKHEREHKLDLYRTKASTQLALAMSKLRPELAAWGLEEIHTAYVRGKDYSNVRKLILKACWEKIDKPMRIKLGSLLELIDKMLNAKYVSTKSINLTAEELKLLYADMDDTARTELFDEMAQDRELAGTLPVHGGRRVGSHLKLETFKTEPVKRVESSGSSGDEDDGVEEDDYGEEGGV